MPQLWRYGSVAIVTAFLQQQILQWIAIAPKNMCTCHRSLPQALGGFSLVFIHCFKPLVACHCLSPQALGVVCFHSSPHALGGLSLLIALSPWWLPSLVASSPWWLVSNHCLKSWVACHCSLSRALGGLSSLIAFYPQSVAITHRLQKQANASRCCCCLQY